MFRVERIINTYEKGIVEIDSFDEGSATILYGFGFNHNL